MEIKLQFPLPGTLACRSHGREMEIDFPSSLPLAPDMQSVCVCVSLRVSHFRPLIQFVSFFRSSHSSSDMSQVPTLTFPHYVFQALVPPSGGRDSRDRTPYDLLQRLRLLSITAPGDLCPGDDPDRMRRDSHLHAGDHLHRRSRPTGGLIHVHRYVTHLRHRMNRGLVVVFASRRVVDCKSTPAHDTRFC